MLEVLFAVSLGIALAACCGLRAFLPLFVAAMAARAGTPGLLGEHFTWLESTPALVGLGVAVIVEMAADKIPTKVEVRAWTLSGSMRSAS